MTHVTIRNGQIVGPELHTLPAAAPRLDTGAWVTPADRAWTPALLAACGITPVQDTPRPADTATHTTTRTVTLLAGIPTETWTPRPWTLEEQTTRTETSNSETLRARARTTLGTNTTYLAIAAPTTAQNTAQIKALTRQVSALIRLEVHALEVTD